MDEEGFLRIVDRKKDMIRFPVLTSIPTRLKMSSCSILRTGSRGCWRTFWLQWRSGENFVVKKDPSLTEESLVTFCRLSSQATKYRSWWSFVMSYRN